MYLKKPTSFSSATRHRFLPEYIKNNFNRISRFFYFKKFSNKGKNLKKQLIIFTKKNPKYLNLKVIKSLAWTKQTALVIDFQTIFLRGIFYLLKYANGSISLQKSIYGVFIGNFLNSYIFFKNKRFYYIGWNTTLKFVPLFSIISNVSELKFKPLKYSSASGCYAQIVEKYKDFDFVKIRLSSGIKKIVSENSICIFGRNSNIYKKYSIFGSYKLSNILGKRPIVRGVAMNPVDHPHGGRTKTNKPEVSPWNWVTKHSH